MALGQRPDREARRSSSVLVGRERELRLLGEAAGRPPALVVIDGEAGVGKSRLVDELVRGGGFDGAAELGGSRAGGGPRVLVGRCHRLREPFPLGSVIDALRDVAGDALEGLSPVAGALRGLLPELASRLPPAPEPLGDPRAERHRVLRALLELIGALGPVVLVLEDLHWADQATIELLELLVGGQPEGLCLVLTYRREGLADRSGLLGLAARAPSQTLTRIVALTSLGPADVRDLIEGMLGGQAVSDELAGAVCQRTAGNPFAVEQLVGLLCDRGELVYRGGRWTLGPAGRMAIPPLVRDSVLERAGRLGPDPRMVMRAAAVLERPAGERLLATVAGLAPGRARTALCEALATGLLRESPEGGFGFCHQLAAGAVYEATPSPARAELHVRAARALERSPDPRPLAQIAHHFKEAGRSRQWVRYAELAADALIAVGEDRDAARILQEALSAPQLTRAARVRMAIKLGDAALYGRIPGPAIAILTEVMSGLELPRGLRGELRLTLSWLLQVAGEGRAGYQEMALAAEELNRRPRLAARAMADVAAYLPAERDGDRPALWIDRALEAAAGQVDPAVRTRIQATRAEALLHTGDPAAWPAVERIRWRATGIDEQLELVRAGKRLGQAALLLGHHRRAQSLLDDAERLRERLQHERFGVGIAIACAALDWRTGRWEGLRERTLSLLEASAQLPGMQGSSQLILSWLALSAGELDEAERGFAAVLELAREARALDGLLAAAAGGLARVRLGRRQPEMACEVTDLGMDALARSGLWARACGVMPIAVDALLACDRRTEAHEWTRQLASGLSGSDAPAAIAALRICRAALAEADGHDEAAVRGFAAAERAWSGLPWPYEAARARDRRGRCLLAHRDAEGVQHLVGALDEFARLGATWDAARVRATLRAHDVAMPHPWRGGRKGYGPELSPREAEVARLAGMGKTNREIAETLVISRHTAAHHVSAVLRKLALPSRQALAPLAGTRR